MAALQTATLRTPAPQAASSAAAAAPASPAWRQQVSIAVWQNAAGTRSATYPSYSIRYYEGTEDELGCSSADA